MASGKVSAYDTHMAMLDVIPKLFSRRIFPPIPMYNRDSFKDSWSQLGLSGFMMRECKTRFMCSAISHQDFLTHFFKSWHPEESRYELYTVQVRSWAAPLFFGKIVDEAGVWGDGGCGLFNCPLGHTLTQLERLGWLGEEQVHVLSIGTGHHVEKVSRQKAKKASNLRQILSFFNLDDGGMARYESVQQAVSDAQARVGYVNGYSFQRLDTSIPKRLDKLDYKKGIPEYLQVGREMVKQIEWDKLRE
jgi:hypothetical protein